jgi:hypothetical protein
VGQLKVIVQRHHGTVVTRAEQATHEIVPDVSQEEDDGDYCRTIQEQVVTLPWGLAGFHSLIFPIACPSFPCGSALISRDTKTLC